MKRFVCTLAALAAVLVPARGTAQDQVWNRYTLGDLGGVFVRVEADEPCESMGVTRRDAQADGVRVSTQGGVVRGRPNPGRTLMPVIRRPCSTSSRSPIRPFG